MIKQHIYHFFNLFYLQDWVIIYEDQCLTIFRIHKYSIHLISQLYWIHYSLYYCYILFSTFFCSIQKYMTCMISFSRFSDVLPSFTFASAIGYLWSICFGVNILMRFRSETLATRAKSEGCDSNICGIPLPFCYLLKSRIFSTISTILTVCSHHAMYAFQSESTLYSCLNVKQLHARNRCVIWSLSGYNKTWVHNHLVRKQTLTYPNWVYELSVRLQIKWLWVRVPLQSQSTILSGFSFSLFFFH